MGLSEPDIANYLVVGVLAMAGVFLCVLVTALVVILWQEFRNG